MKSGKGSRDAAVYMLDPWWLNKLVYKELPIAKADRPVGTAMPDWEETKPYLSEDEFENEYIGPKFLLAIPSPLAELRVQSQTASFLRASLISAS